jgi:hypothetical protein
MSSRAMRTRTRTNLLSVVVLLLVSSQRGLQMLQSWHADAWIPIKRSSRVYLCGSDAHVPFLHQVGPMVLSMFENEHVLSESLQQAIPRSEGASSSPESSSKPTFKIRQCNYSGMYFTVIRNTLSTLAFPINVHLHHNLSFCNQIHQN